MDSRSGRARSRWIKRKEVFVSSSNTTDGMLEGDEEYCYEVLQIQDEVAWQSGTCNSYDFDDVIKLLTS